MGVLAAPASISGWGICLTVREEALLLERNLSCRSFFRGVVFGNALAGGLAALFANLPAKNLSHQCRNPVLPSEKNCPRRLLRDSCPNLSEELDSSVLHLSPHPAEGYREISMG